MNADRKNLLIIIFTLLGAYCLTLLPFPEVFSQDAVVMMAIAVVGAVFWITECIPISLTALMIILLQALTGIIPISQGLGYIATPVNSIIFAGFIMAAALSKYNLDRRIGLMIVGAMGKRTDKLILGIMVATGFLSMWISNSASTAIMLPIAVGIMKMDDSIVAGSSNLGRAMTIGIAYAANIGGMGTPAGTPASSLTIAFIDQLLGVQLGFLDWFMRAAPVVALLIPLAWKLLLVVYPPEKDTIEGGGEMVQKELQQMGPLSAKQKHVYILLALALFLWTADSFLSLMPGWLYIASVIISLIFVMPGVGVVKWKEASPQIGWGIFILVGGGLALGSGLTETGVVSIIAQQMHILLAEANVLLSVTFLAFVTAMSITFFSSLTATSTTFVPVAVGLAQQLGMNPVLLGITTGLASCMAFLLPANTPPNAITYAAGYFKSYEMTKSGLLLTAASVVVLSIVANLLWF